MASRSKRHQNAIYAYSSILDAMDKHLAKPYLQGEATEEVISIMEENPEMLVYLGMHTLGKEELMVSLARRRQTWVGVARDRYETLKLLEMPDVFQTDEEMEQCTIQVYPFHMLFKSMLDDLKSNGSAVLGILPTCMFLGLGAPAPPTNRSIRIVPYSDHSSFKELREFVKSVRPRSVKPIVHRFSGDKSLISARVDMSVFKDCLEGLPPLRYTIPPSICSLLSMKGHSSNVAQPHPPLRKRSSLGSSGNRRKRPSGVQYLSPSKSFSTNMERENRGDGQQEDTGSHEPANTVTDSKCRPFGEVDNMSRESRGAAEKEGEISEAPRISLDDKAFDSGKPCHDVSTATEPNPLGETNRVHSLVSQLKICNPASCATTADRTADLGPPVDIEDDSIQVQSHMNGPCRSSDHPNHQTSVPVPESSPSSVHQQHPPSLSDYSKLFGNGNGSTSSITRNATRKLPATVLALGSHTENAAGQSTQPGIEDFFGLEKRSCQTQGSSISFLSMLIAQEENSRELIMELQRHDLTSPAVQRILKAALELGSDPSRSVVHSKEGVASPDGGVTPTTIHDETEIEPPSNDICEESARQAVGTQQANSTVRPTGKGKEKLGTKRGRKVCENDKLPNHKKPCRELPVNSITSASDTSLGCPQELAPQHMHLCDCQGTDNFVCSFGLDEFFCGGIRPEADQHTHNCSCQGTDVSCSFGLHPFFSLASVDASH